MRHYLYKTTNIIKGKIYVGVHSCVGEFGEDGYLGSGKILIQAIKKNGRDNFKCEVLCEAPSREEVFELEELVVDWDFIYRENTYNLALGGNGSPSNHTEESKAKMRYSQKQRPKRSKEHCYAISRARKGKGLGKSGHTGKNHNATRQIECPYCGKVGGANVMPHRHIANCQQKEISNHG